MKPGGYCFTPSTRKKPSPATEPSGSSSSSKSSPTFASSYPSAAEASFRGIAAVVKALRPGCRVIGVQPTANPSMALSVEQGRRVTVTPGPTLADALTVATPGERTLEIVERCVDQVLLVEEEEIIEGVRTLAAEQKLVVEPGGAVGAAALLSNKIDSGNLDVVLILSGGNILPSKLAELLSGDR